MEFEPFEFKVKPAAVVRFARSPILMMGERTVLAWLELTVVPPPTLICVSL